ncbi:uncharacterized protein VSU04_009657 [Chlamydotis macqueenii]
MAEQPPSPPATSVAMDCEWHAGAGSVLDRQEMYEEPEDWDVADSESSPSGPPNGEAWTAAVPARLPRRNAEPCWEMPPGPGAEDLLLLRNGHPERPRRRMPTEDGDAAAMPGRRTADHGTGTNPALGLAIRSAAAWRFGEDSLSQGEHSCQLSLLSTPGNSSGPR